MIGKIYLIRNLLNGKGYVGQTQSPLTTRFRRHKFDAYRGSQSALHLAIRKYGIENFLIQEIASCPFDLLNDSEEHYIKFFGTHVDFHGYNMTSGGEGVRGYAHSLEARKRMSLAHKLRKRVPHSKETRAKMSAWQKGRKLSESHKANIRKAAERRKHV